MEYEDIVKAESHDYMCPECGHIMDTWDEYKYHYLFCSHDQYGGMER